MKMRIILSLLAVGILAPSATSALSADDVQLQIRALMQQIIVLQQQLRQLQGQGGGNWSDPNSNMGTSITPWNNGDTAAGWRTPCPAITRSLMVGVQGDDVTNLQTFLSNEGVFHANATGYFGSVTSNALKQWQGQNQITPVGIVGPQTRMAIAKRCGGNGGSGNLTAVPRSGAAPLSVTFGANAPRGALLTIDFGDGSSAGMELADGRDTCQTYNNPAIPLNTASGMSGPNVGMPSVAGCQYRATHVYTENGTYSAKLSVTKTVWQPCQISYDPSNPNTLFSGANLCTTVATTTATTVIGTVMLNITAAPPPQPIGFGVSLPAHFSATPTSGRAPLGVSFSAKGVKDASYVVEFGDGQHQVTTQKDNSCDVGVEGTEWCPFFASHTYAAPGTYTATLSPYAACMYTEPRCMMATTLLGSVQITVAGI